MAKKLIKKTIETYEGEKINVADAVELANTTGLYAKKGDKNVSEDYFHKGIYLYTPRTGKESGGIYRLHAEPRDGKLTKILYTRSTGKSDRERITSKTISVRIDNHSLLFYGHYNELLKNGFVENYKNGYFYSKNNKLPDVPQMAYRKFNHPFVNPDDRVNKFRYGMISLTNMLSEHKPYTFGVELETSGGYVPPHLNDELNMDCQYDGSIVDEAGNKGPGGEYTTGVLYGDNGFKHLYQIMNQLSKRCIVNKSCSVHVHLGRIIFNKEMTVLLYKMYQMIEKELFEMMPDSRNYREHCKKMHKKDFPLVNRGIPYSVLIDKYYRDIFSTMSLGQNPSAKVNKKFNHPKGKTCGWDKSTPRYWWVNFVPALFNIKGEDNYTIEVRNMHATLDFELVKNWVLINMGIVSFVENNIAKMRYVNNITLEEIMRSEFKTKADYLIAHIEERKTIMSATKNSMLKEEKLVYDKSKNITEDIEDISIKKVLMK